jgi:hypothetical protein
MGPEIIYVDTGGFGYHPLRHMARLVAQLFETELIVLPRRSLSLPEKAYGLLPRRRRGLPGILICPAPFDLAAILSLKNWRSNYGRLVAWVFDSFWPDYLSRVIRFSNVFDQIFITELEELNTWRGLMASPVNWLPWGSDALAFGSANPVRALDLVRLGRQPPSWENDAETQVLCASMQLTFQSRPPSSADPSEGERLLMKVLSDAKFTLSFSNLASPGPHTHPTRAYITGRWTDALSAGSIVAGIPPRSKTVQALLWDGALLDFETVDRARGLNILADAVREWRPKQAMNNHLRSLQVLDWRWRFVKLADALGLHVAKLNDELAVLRQTISDLSCAGS